MKTQPRFQTIDTQDFTDGQVPVWDADNFRFIPSDAGSAYITTITGTFNIAALGLNEQVEVLVDHHTDAVFAFCEYPVITAAPEGVIVTVLARGYNNDSTNGQQFVLLVTNGETGHPGYDGSISGAWSLKGYV